MVVPEEREGRTGAAMMLSRDPSKATDAVNTRKAGGQDGEKKTSRKVSLNFETLFAVTFKFSILKQAESQVSFAKYSERNSVWFESGRVFLGSGIWPNTVRDSGNLTGCGIWLLHCTQEAGFSIILARDAGMGKQTIFVIAMTEVLDAGSPALVLDPISFVGYSKEVLL